jgi:DNA-binding CsgD family transcriptional regulator
VWFRPARPGRRAGELAEGLCPEQLQHQANVLPAQTDGPGSLPKDRVLPALAVGPGSLPKDRVLPALAVGPGSLSKEAPPDAQGPLGDRLAFEIDGELSAQLSLTAHARGQTVGGLIADLIARGLQQDVLRSQAEAALASLTPREQEVAWLTVRGHTNPQIAEALIVSPETVKTHVAHVLEKFGVRSKTELRVRFLDLGVRWWEAGRR